MAKMLTWRPLHQRPHSPLKTSRHSICYWSPNLTSMARVAANTSENLAPFFEALEFIMISSKRSLTLVVLTQHAGLFLMRSQSSIGRKKLRSLEKYARFQIWHMGKLLAASQSTMELATLPSYHLCCLMEPSSRTGILFRESVYKKNISAIRFLLV